MSVSDSFNNLFKKFSNNSSDRSVLVDKLNELFKYLYTYDHVDLSCKANITSGNEDFKHETSASFSKSGLKITIEKTSVTDAEVRDVSRFFLSDKQFIKVLMNLGFDTLIIAGKDEKTSVLYCIRDYYNYSNFTFD